MHIPRWLSNTPYSSLTTPHFYNFCRKHWTLSLTVLKPPQPVKHLGNNVNTWFTIFIGIDWALLTYNFATILKHTTTNRNPYYFFVVGNTTTEYDSKFSIQIPDNMHTSLWWSNTPLSFITILQVTDSASDPRFAEKTPKSNSSHFYNFCANVN